jgi:hypothetical protein
MTRLGGTLPGVRATADVTGEGQAAPVVGHLPEAGVSRRGDLIDHRSDERLATRHQPSAGWSWMPPHLRSGPVNHHLPHRPCP